MMGYLGWWMWRGMKGDGVPGLVDMEEGGGETGDMGVDEEEIVVEVCKRYGELVSRPPWQTGTLRRR